jgi:dimethylhistidine N-methyltransferase
MTIRTASASLPVRTPGDPRTSGVDAERLDVLHAVRFYLQLNPRQLPSRLLYDALGSALFDAICHLPWYRITRSELQLLQQHAPTIGRVLGRHGRVVEPGCGNGEKLATLLKHTGLSDAQVHLIDVSNAALAHAVQTLAAVGEMNLTVTTHQATYEEGLLALPRNDHPTLVAFLGSNIGNFDPPGAAAFLSLIRRSLRPRDYLLLGADLVKPESQLLLAYDDPLGLTAAFNKNLLVRLNHEVSADFELDQFAHRAVWNASESRVEMHLVSLVSQTVHVPDAGFDIRLDEGETIWTESSYKYELSGIRNLVEPAGFVERNHWIDEDARFALTLFEAV